MRLLVLGIVLTILAVQTLGGEAEAETENPTVQIEAEENVSLDWSIETSKKTFFPGEPVLLKLNIKNNSNEEVNINFGSHGIGAFSIETQNSANEVVSHGGNIQRSGFYMGASILKIHPDKIGVKPIVLNQWCSTLLPVGRYHIICHVKYASGTDYKKVRSASLLINGFNRTIDLELDIEVVSSDDSKFTEILDELIEHELKTEEHPTDEWVNARAIAREMIAFTESDLAVPYQIRLLKDNPSTWLKWDIINSLAKSGTLEAAEGLVQIFEDPSVNKDDMKNRIIDAIYRLRETEKPDIISLTDEFVVRHKRPILSEPMD